MRRLVAAAYIVGALIVTVQRGVYGFASDFAIFRAASHNLAAGLDLYVVRPEQAQDLFKYTPSFAALFTPYAALPVGIGLAVWNLTGALLLLVAMRQLLPPREALGAQILVYLAMLRNAQSAQSNSLIAALMILGFAAVERERQWPAAGYIAVGAAIKVFPAAAALVVWPHRHRRRFAMALAMVGVLLAALPLLIVSASTLRMEYHSLWSLHGLQRSDVGLSAMAVLSAVWGRTLPQWMVQMAGTVILALPLLAARRVWSQRPLLRQKLLASILLYCVLFNHKAEASSYVIALAGVAVWWGSSPRQAWRLWVALLVVAVTNLPSADFVPAVVKTTMTPLWRGPIACTLFWLGLQGELLGEALRIRREGEGRLKTCERHAG